MEQVTLTSAEKQKKVEELIARAERGIDVSDADPRETSIEAVVAANKISRAKGSRAINMVQSAL